MLYILMLSRNPLDSRKFFTSLLSTIILDLQFDTIWNELLGLTKLHTFQGWILTSEIFFRKTWLKCLSLHSKILSIGVAFYISSAVVHRCSVNKVILNTS